MKFRKYTVNENFFDTWSEPMAYALGFITSDGSIHKSSLSIELKKQDIEILKFIKKNIKTTSPIESTKKRTSVRLRINSVSVIKSLLSYNVVPAKSKIIRANFYIPQKFIPSYIRGVFDGDGWVYLRRNSIECGICSGSKKFLEDLRHLCNIKGRTIRPRQKITKKGKISICYSWEMGKKDSLLLRDLMYSIDTFSLKRKKDIFFSDFYKRSSRFWTPEQIQYLKLNFKPKTRGLLNQLGKDLKKSKKAVSKKAWELKLY